MQEMNAERTPIREISCTLIPGEEVVFSDYAGPPAAEALAGGLGHGSQS